MLPARRNGQTVNCSSGARRYLRIGRWGVRIGWSLIAQLQDVIHAAQEGIVLAGKLLLAVKRALQEQVRQDMRALQEQARQDMRAGEQVIAYPGEASTAQPCLQDLFDNWDAGKLVSNIASSDAEAALGRQASGRWAWLSIKNLEVPMAPIVVRRAPGFQRRQPLLLGQSRLVRKAEGLQSRRMPRRDRRIWRLLELGWLLSTVLD